MNKRNVTIIGAGLVGSLLAILLKMRGFEVRVFEKRSDIRKAQNAEGRSINLILTSRGIHALKSANLFNEVQAFSVPVHGRTIHNKLGQTYYQPYGKTGEYNLSISRSLLNKFLIEKAENLGIPLSFESPLQDIDFKNKKLIFEKSNNINYDLLFATDGAASAVRKSLIKNFSNNYVEKIERLPVDYIELFMPSGPNDSYKINENTLHIWPRGSHMLMALANLNGSFTMTLYMPTEGERHSFTYLNNKEKIIDFFKTEFADATSLMPTLESDFLSRKPGKLSTIRLSNWTLEDSVALMGDSAHAIVPFFGQGMNCGFEDCTELLRLIENKKSWTEILHQFSSIRIKNANAIADMALENWFEMSSYVADANFLLKKKIEAQLEKKFPHLYKSRYGMVAYTLIPYSYVKQIGKLQNQIISNIIAHNKFNQNHLNIADNILFTNDFYNDAETRINSQLVPLFDQLGCDLI